MEFRELRSLSQVAETRSILTTSAKLHLSPAAVHKHIRNLESELGVRLYEKVGHHLEITPAAEILLPHVNGLLADYELLLSSLAEWSGLRSGRVRIGTGPTLSSSMLPMLLKGFRRKFPKVDLFVETGGSSTLLQKFDQRLLDLLLIVWMENQDPAGCSVERLWPFEISLVAHKGTLPPGVSFSDLRRQTFILYQEGSRLACLTDRYFAAIGFTPRVTMRFDNAEAIKAMISSGLGISMLPFWTVRKEAQEGRLAIVRQAERPLLGSIALLSSKLAQTSAPVRAFVEFARTFENTRLHLTSRPVET